MQDDAVEEPAQPQPEQDAGGDWEAGILGPRIAHGAAAYSPCLGSKRSAAPFMQKRWPVGAGPSGKTWPRCARRSARNAPPSGS